MFEIEMEVLLRPESDELRFLPEGPYPYGDGKISWVAIQHGPNGTSGSINILDLGTRANVSHPLAGRPGFAFPTDRPSVFVVGEERRLDLVNIATGETTLLCDGIDKDVAGTIVNDGVAFSGGLVFGCKDLKFAEKKAGLYLWRRSDRKLIRLRGDQICSNGKIVHGSGDRVTLLDIDTPTQTVVRYELDVAAGKLGGPKVVVDLRGQSVYPDGMIATPDGRGVIISMYNPNDAPHGETRQYSLADGRLDGIWKSPGSPQATCPQLVRHGGKIKLVVTTAVEHMPAERRSKSPHAGCLFIADTSFDALPATPWLEIGG